MQQKLRMMAKGAIAAACLLLNPFLSETAKAQTPVTIGNPLSTSYSYQIPVNSLWGYSYTQQILLSSDIGMNGVISKIRFKYNTGSLVNNDNWTVYLGYKSGSTFTSTTDWVPISALTNVYSGTVSAAGGWIELTLTTPFTYNVSSGNLVVAVDENAPSYTYTNNMFAINSSGSDYRAIYYNSDGTNPDPASPPTATSRLQSYNTVQLDITGAPCSGTPVAGITSSATNACAGVPFNLSGAPSGLAGLTYQFQSSTDGTIWSNLGGVTPTYVYTVMSQTVATQYRVIITCSGGSADTSAPVSVGQNVPTDCYCTPVTTSGATSYISNFTTTGGITNISKISTGSTTGYSDYHTTDMASAMPNTLINFSMTTNSSSFGRAIWVDYNEDGIFQTSERVANTTSYVTGAWTGSFTIPAGTTPGNKRMRIVATLSISNPTDPCIASSSGEYEDYTLNVVPFPVCAGMPNPGATLANTTSVCIGGTASLSLENNPMVSGLSYQWQASTDGGTTYTAITGDTNKVTSVIPMVPGMYRARVICSSGPDTAYSTPIAIGFNATIDSVSTASVCGTGSTTLQAFADTAVSVYWYDAPAGGTLLDSGNSFTTPVISATTTYYAEPVTMGAGDVTVGGGTMTSVSGSPDYSGQSPFTYHYGNYKHQMLVRASELSAAGLMAGEITSLGFTVTGPAGSGTPYGTLNNFTVSLKPTTTSTMTSAFETGTSVVWTGNYTPVTGANTFTFTTPFMWDGVSNIIVQTCYNNNNSGNMDASAEVLVDPTSFAAHTIYRTDGTTPGICDVPSGNSSNDGPLISNRPQMTFGSTGLCAGPRVPVVVTIGAAFAVNLGADTAFCAGDPLTLDAGVTGATYIWNTGDNTQTISVTSAGTYMVSVNQGGCTVSDTIVIDEVATPVAATIVVVDNMPEFDFSAPGTTGAATYAWDFGDGTTAATETASHTYTANGVFTVTLVVTNECGQTGSVTTTVNVSGVGVNAVAGKTGNVQVYPNPSSGLTVVEAKGATIKTLEVVDNLGRVILRTQPNAAKTVIDVKGMAQGIYTLRIQTTQGSSTMKLVVGK